MSLTRTPPAYKPPPAAQLTTLFADAHILVANKPSGLLSVPGRGPEKALCAQSILSERHGAALTVHRLDMDTSGLMVFARTPQAHRRLSASFERRETDKTYIAIVDGDMAKASGTIDLPIAKYSRQRPLRHIEEGGRPSVTKWHVISHSAKTTRVMLHPITGRSHQLRLHLSAIGHPILGCAFYGDPGSAERLMLHAETLAFPHPDTGKRLEFTAPPDF